MPKRMGRRQRGGFLGQARQSLAFVTHSGMAKALFLLAFATGVGLAAVETYWQPALSALQPPPWLLGAFSFLGFASVILGSAYTERRMAAKPRTGLGFLLAQKALTALFIGVLILPGSAGAFLGVYGCVYLFLGSGSVAETTLLNRQAPSAQRAGILSLYSFTLQAGGLLASVMGYLIAAAADFRLTWVFGAAVMLLAVAAIASTRLLRRRQA